MGHALGDAGEGMGIPTKWTEVVRDHGDKLEIGAQQIDGKQKIRFDQSSDNKVTDYGVAVLDSYAPDPSGSDGETLRSALKTATT